MCKEGWCVGLGQEEVAWGWGGTVWNTLKEGGSEKAEGEIKILKRRGQAGSRTGCLKKGGLEPPHDLSYIWTDFISFTCFNTLFMLHASATFKGGDIWNFWEGGWWKPYMGRLSILWGGGTLETTVLKTLFHMAHPNLLYGKIFRFLFFIWWQRVNRIY